MTTDLSNNNYANLLQNLKIQISQTRMRAHLSVNKELISLYWKIGHQILQRQQAEGWGTKVIENISKDLREEFPEMKGLSARNLKYMRKFAEEYQDETFVQTALAQITWYHNITLLEKVEDYNKRVWYINETVKNGWSRNVMVAQIQTNLYARDGSSINNFNNTLPALQSDLASSIMKDPYNLEFLDIAGKFHERELEGKLIDHIRNFYLN